MPASLTSASTSPAPQPREQRFDAAGLVVLVQRKQRACDPAGGEQRAGAARVLGEHEVGRGEAFARARAQIANIAYWRRNDFEPARSRLPL